MGNWEWMMVDMAGEGGVVRERREVIQRVFNKDEVREWEWMDRVQFRRHEERPGVRSASD
jgi:hypothetical protein